MGLLGNIVGGITGALNPVGLVANLGAGLLGGGLDFLGQQQTNEVNATNVKDTNALNWRIAQQNMQMQEDFAKNGISWRIADAAKNGISPLAALGASEPGYSPVSAAFQAAPYASPLSTLGPNLRDMGQNVSRALMATQSPMQKASDALDLAYKQKQIDWLQTQIDNSNLNLAIRTAGASPGIPNAWVTVRNKDGTLSDVPSAEAYAGAHGQLFGRSIWSVHNQLMPGFGEGGFGNVGAGGTYSAPSYYPRR